MARGIDVYQRYQTVHDWRAVKAAGYQFAYIKVSDGTTTRDDGGYAAAAKNAGVLVGGYHYAQFGDATAQADLLCDRVEAIGATDLGPALDLEDPFGEDQTAVDFAIEFLQHIRARGHRPVIYANDSMMSFVLPRILTHVPDVLTWVARYASNTSTEPELRPSVHWDVHQFSQAGRVPGITGGVDLNDGSIPHNQRGGDGPPASTSHILEEHMHECIPGGKRVVPITVPSENHTPVFSTFGAGGVAPATLTVHNIRYSSGNDKQRTVHNGDKAVPTGDDWEGGWLHPHKGEVSLIVEYTYDAPVDEHGRPYSVATIGFREK